MKKVTFIVFSLLLILGFSACVDNTIDEPPIKEAPVVETNATVADVKAKWIAGQIVEITEDLTFDAIVSADDETGNFYKNVVIQDETGGITVRIEANNIYTVLPVGRQVFIKAQGLYISDYNGLIQLGFGESDGNLLTIPFTLVDDISEEAVIVPGLRGQEVTAALTTFNTLGNNAINTLVKFDEVEFATFELGETYANADDQQSENRTLVDCDGNEIVVRTSGFSSFAGEAIAEGNGTFTCIYSVFGATKQLLIRDLSDIELTGTRCGDGPDPNAPDPNATIADVMAKYSEGNVVDLTEDLVFEATVIADDLTGNFYKQIVVQDATGGMNIQIDAFDIFNKFNVGKSIIVSTKGLAIGDYGGLPQIGVNEGGEVKRIPETQYPSHLFAGEVVGDVTPTVRKIDQISSDDLNSLVQLNDVEFIGGAIGSTYADANGQISFNHDLSDCDDNVIVFRTSGFADFASSSIPEGNGSVTAVVGTFNGTTQLVVRNTSDVDLEGERCDGTGTGGDPVEEINQNFDGLAAGVDVNIADWTNEVVKGVRLWRTKEFSGNTYVQATAYQDDEAEMETWLVTPEIKTSGSNMLSFRSAKAFHEHDGLSVWVSTDYDGDATAANWTQLSASLAGSAQGDYDWVESGAIDLSAYSENFHIGFKYEGTGSANTTTYIIDDVVLTK